MSIDHEKQFKLYLEKEKHIALMFRNRVTQFGDKTAMKDKPYGDWRETT